MKEIKSKFAFYSFTIRKQCDYVSGTARRFAVYVYVHVNDTVE